MSSNVEKALRLNGTTKSKSNLVLIAVCFLYEPELNGS